MLSPARSNPVLAAAQAGFDGAPCTHEEGTHGYRAYLLGKHLLDTGRVRPWYCAPEERSKSRFLINDMLFQVEVHASRASFERIY